MVLPGSGSSKVKLVVAVVGVLTASVGGAFALGLVGAPTVEAVENRFGPVDEQTTVVFTDLVLDNPNPVGVQLGGTTVNYTVNMNDVAIASGSKAGLDVDPGNTTLEFQTEMQNGKIPPWWVTHVQNGERTNVTIDANVRTSLLGDRTFDIEQEETVQTDIIGQFNSTEPRPVNSPQTPPTTSNPVLYINRTTANWGTVTQAETPIDMEFVLYNPKIQPYVITEVGYEIRMNDVLVGQGESDRNLVIPGGATETLNTETVITNEKLDDWWVTHLQNDQVTELRIDFYAKVDLPVVGEVRVPLDRLTYEKTIETDIFGNKDEAPDTENSANTAATLSPTRTASGDESGIETAVPTPTGADVTDGGLLDGNETTDRGLPAVREPEFTGRISRCL